MAQITVPGRIFGKIACVVLAAALAATLVAAPVPAQDQPGGARASIEIAKSPSVAARRAKLMETVKDGLLIIPSQSSSRGGLRDNLNFVYLTGLREPDAVLVLDPAGDPRETVFRRPARRDGTAASGGGGGQAPGREGPKPGPGLVERPADQLAAALRGLAFSGRAKRIGLPFSDLDFLVRTFGASGPPGPFGRSDAIFNIDPALAEMRLTKDAEEIAALREAVDLTAEALTEAFRAAEPKMREVDLAAVLRFYFDRRGTDDSFLQAASGPNATNIHFGATARPLASGDLVVFDVGAYIRGYTSDISRTIPASGRFTKEQRAIYELVLSAEKAGCAKLVPGITFKAVQTEVEDILMAGLAGLGLVTDARSPWQRRLYIQHGFGHGIGLDVHDAWSWHSPRLDKVVMAPGMVMTMEPGLYFPEVRLEAFLDGLEGQVPGEEIAAFREKVGPVYKRYAGIGVRIEDDVLITAGGSEILSGRVPKEAAEAEKTVREKSPFNLVR